MAARMYQSNRADNVYGEHDYARSEKDSERLPSFHSFHSYALPFTVTPKKQKGKRCRGTPTGLTPIPPSKMTGQPVGSKWTDREKKFLQEYMGANPMPSPTPNEYWRALASSLNVDLGVSRTGASCKSFYARFSKSTNTETRVVGSLDIQHVPVFENKSCQTDLCIPVDLSEPSPLEDENIRIKEDKTTAMLRELAFKRKSHQDYEELARQLLDNKTLKECLWSLFVDDIDESANYLTHKGNSYLGNLKYQDLRNFQWNDVIEEMYHNQPKLLEILLAVSTGKKKCDSEQHYREIVKELGLVYGILMKRRCHVLSRIQRVIALAMADENVHQKVYDRLQPLGVTVSHGTMNRVQEQIGGHFNHALIQAVTEGKKFRIVGDNVNFMISTSHQRKGNSSKMEHWFASAAIIQNNIFSHLPADPQCPLLDIPPTGFIPSEQDLQIISKDYVYIVFQILMKHMKFFRNYQHLEINWKLTLRAKDCDMNTKNVIVPMPVLCKNEQSYADVVEILDNYEDQIIDVYRKSDTNVDEVKVHIGGDQLTRERFSGAKRIRQQAATDKERFLHLSPITFEFFHLQMAILTMLYKLLYNENSREAGTLYAEKIKLGRTHANGKDVKNHYDQCKELASSVNTAHLIVAAMHHFNMNSVDDEPTMLSDMANSELSDDEKQQLLSDNLLTFVKKYILKDALNIQNPSGNTDSQPCIEVTIISPDGSPMTILVPVQKQSPDAVECYSSRILELGMAYESLCLNVKIPNRERMLPLLKYLMCILKGHNWKSKYALEILRFLCQQASMDLKSANETFYGLFVNSSGKADSCIAADLQMEHLVRLIKENLKAVHSNKTEKTMVKRSSALSGMKAIADQFDSTSDTLIRASRHKIPSSCEDELLMIKSLVTIKPFACVPGRQMISCKKPIRSPLKEIKTPALIGWIREHQYLQLHELGN